MTSNGHLRIRNGSRHPFFKIAAFPAGILRTTTWMTSPSAGTTPCDSTRPIPQIWSEFALSSFMPERIDWISCSSFNGLIADCEKCYDPGKSSCCNKYSGIDTGAVSKVLKPLVHNQIRCWPGNYISQKNPFSKFF